MKLAIVLSCCLLGAAPAVSVEPDCVKTANKLEVGGHEREITLAEANQIKQAVDRYWPKAKKKVEPSVYAPGPVFVDCWGTIHLGAWLLESAHSSSEPELSLTFRIATTDLYLMRQIISLKQVDGRWKAVDVSMETFHLLR